jgi:hypothetical protein
MTRDPREFALDEQLGNIREPRQLGAPPCTYQGFGQIYY